MIVPRRLFRILSLVIAMLTLPATRGWAATVETNSVPGNMLLLDSMGRVVSVPTNEVPSALQPGAAIGLGRQIPDPTRGSSMPHRRRRARVPVFPGSSSSSHALSRQPG
jgi:hypothetical protein